MYYIGVLNWWVHQHILFLVQIESTTVFISKIVDFYFLSQSSSIFIFLNQNSIRIFVTLIPNHNYRKETTHQK